MKDTIIRRVVSVSGTVQGVGFRPAVFRLATSAGLTGWVRNCAGEVQLCVEGLVEGVDSFLNSLPGNLPKNARIETIRTLSSSRISSCDRSASFVIEPSDSNGPRRVTIPPDLRICPSCRQEIRSETDRRSGYPFTTCTACGPRYSVVTGTPYDRDRTTMVRFPLCGKCRKEYESPGDRRFHAESIACPDCGPRLTIEGAEVSLLPPLSEARRLLAAGRIVAVKAIGGFQLAADAFNRATVSELRRRKHRPDKPLAVMARNMEVVRRFTSPSPAETDLLQSPEGPIVIMDTAREAMRATGLPLDLIAPDTATLGVMLPTSPLHELLMEPVEPDGNPVFDVLIMTSGNRRSEPICISINEARERLKGIADAFLTHDRDINLRSDDSVSVISNSTPIVWRRARGYAPRPIILHRPVNRRVIAMGAELKNTVALAYDTHVVLSPHIGDLETPEAIAGLERALRELPHFLEQEPECVAVDMHPDFHSSSIGRKIASAAGIPLVSVQHHHAHGLACLAEHGLDSCLALAFDGTGYGPDGTIWGAELLEVDTSGYRRLATFKAVPLPGGDMAVQQPVRQLLARLLVAGCEVPDPILSRLGISAEQFSIWRQQCATLLNAPLTHAAGRVFDAFSCALGLCPDSVTYEAQGAIHMETAARRHHGAVTVTVPFDAHNDTGLMTIDWTPAFRLAMELIQRPGHASEWAMSFHQAVARASMTMLQYGLERSKCRTVCLTGGVFMNRLLVELIERQKPDGVRLLQHMEVPPNDGGLSLGQAVAAGWSN